MFVLGENLFVVCREIFLYDDTNRIYFLNENVDNTISPERYELVCSLGVVLDDDTNRIYFLNENVDPILSPERFYCAEDVFLPVSMMIQIGSIF